MGVFVAGVPSSLAPRTPFFSRVLAPLPLPRLRLLRRLRLSEKRNGWPRSKASTATVNFKDHLLSFDIAANLRLIFTTHFCHAE